MKSLKQVTVEVEGKDEVVKVGTWVGFKYDYERSAKVVKITQRDNWVGVITEFHVDDGEGFRAVLRPDDLMK